MINLHYAHLDYSSNFFSARAMAQGLSLPEADGLKREWEVVL